MIIIYCLILCLLSGWIGYFYGHSRGMDDCKTCIKRMIGRIRPVKHGSIYKEDSPYLKHYKDGFNDAIEEVKFWMI